MSIKAHIASIAECRSFVAALCNDIESVERSYLVVEKKEDVCVYSNGLAQQKEFRTQEIIDAAQRTFVALQDMGEDISSSERREMLVSLRGALGQYNDRIKGRGCGKIGRWVQFFVGAQKAPYDQIVKIQEAIDTFLRNVEAPLERESEDSSAVREIIASVEKTWDEVQDKVLSFADREGVNSYVKEEHAVAEKWRAALIELPWNECRKGYQKVWDLEKRIQEYSLVGFYFIEQKKDLKSAQEEVARVKEALGKCEEEFKKRLDAFRGIRDYLPLKWWIETHLSNLVDPLRRNRFCKLQFRDRATPEAVQVSQGIAACIQLQTTLEESFRLQLDQRWHHPSADGIESTYDFPKLMEEMKEDLERARQCADGNEILISAYTRLVSAKQQNRPEMVFSLERFPDEYKEFKSAAKKIYTPLHPDKHLDHTEAATRLFSMTKRICVWTASQKYAQTT